MTSEQILIMLATAVLSFFSGRAQSMANKHDEAVAKKEQLFMEMMENQKKFIAWQEEINNQNAEMKKEIRALQLGVDRICKGGLVLLRDRIIQSCRAFIERGSITITARNNIRDMYKCYHDEFKGNGDGEYFYEEMMNLPVDQDVPIVSHFDVGGGHSDRKN
ncbi:hypothetical protein D081_2209 [Anaerovibrio sp. JC8]|uniref:hypothetical protein n=1 Tax=Anaerovibrio sp. JC8 TaxID=1240085 RepID=UPI000A099B4D|nr:hypothetical protein [Anaerovibrio sp. JC8]ORT99030.1 hypothetical protein D081_2209 [Anaerovibrio sp. JC8]